METPKTTGNSPSKQIVTYIKSPLAGGCSPAGRQNSQDFQGAQGLRMYSDYLGISGTNR